MSASGFPFQVTRGIVARDVEGEGCGDAGGTVGGGVGGRRRGTRRPTNAVLQGGAGVAVAGATSCAPSGERGAGAQTVVSRRFRLLQQPHRAS